MPVIIIEGSDCNYKTTVAEKLSKELGIPIVKGSSFEFAESPNEVLYERSMEIAKLDNVIIDRFIYSNRTYATLYKDYSILTNEQRQEIEDVIRHKATVYYLFADDEIIKGRITERGDDYVDVSMVKKINNLYSEVMMDAAVKISAYDTNDWSSDEIVEEIAGDYRNNN
jgi:thymidylate kinase